MNKISEKLSPSAAKIIRMDHARIIATFHQYALEAEPEIKQASVNANCLAIEILAQIEEEYFYPELRAVVGAEPVLKKCVPENEEIRQSIAQMRSMEPTDMAYDRTYMELMRKVLHHIADEDAVLLPEAERLLAGRLNEIGGNMMKRKMQLMAHHAGQVVSNTVRSQPAKSMLLAAGALLAGAYLVRHSLGKSKWSQISVPSSGMASERASFKLGRLVEMGRGMFGHKRA